MSPSMAEDEEDGFGVADSSASWLELNILSVGISILVCQVTIHLQRTDLCV